MTTYAATFTWTSSLQQKLSVAPSITYPVRIARVEVNSAVSAGNLIIYSVLVYPSNVATSGTVISSFAMRSGAPASSASARTNPTISGTSYTLHSEITASSPTDSSGNAIPAAMNSNYTFPFDLILASGSTIVLQVQNAQGAYSATAVIYYEELRLNWSS